MMHDRIVRYALWSADSNASEQPGSPRLLVTPARVFVGDRLPSGWVTEVIQRPWTDGDGNRYDGQVRVATNPPGAHRS